MYLKFKLSSDIYSIWYGIKLQINKSNNQLPVKLLFTKFRELCHERTFYGKRKEIILPKDNMQILSVFGIKTTNI